MMVNSSQVSQFTLGAYFDPGPLRWLYFFIIMSVYTLIVLSNLLLIVVICLNRTLHEPMYIFLCSLFVNELYGSSALFPFLLLQMLLDVHVVPYSLCYLQIFFVYLYACVEILNLAIMSYDRYLAICFPLQYRSLMTHWKVALLIAATWLAPCLAIIILVLLSLSLPLCGSLIDKVFCGNYAIVKLACSNTKLNNIYGLFYTVLSMICPLFLILYTYVRIFRVCFSASRQTRQKALSTCAPHLASLLNFSFGCCFQIVQSRFDTSNIPNVLGIVLSLYFLTCQPLFTPLIYGLKMSQIRLLCKRMILGEQNS